MEYNILGLILLGWTHIVQADVILILERLPLHLIGCLLMREPKPAAEGILYPFPDACGSFLSCITASKLCEQCP
jgi:hypothetical protein